jgi:hypothetical protein
MRNPWRMSFDRLTGDLYIGDVGQNSWEEVDFQPAGDPGGENYGWRVMEGTHCYNPPSGCITTGMIFPVTEYDHNAGRCSVTGGNVYRGSAAPGLQGIFLYGDFCTGEVFGLIRNPDATWTNALLSDTPYLISSFGEGEDGELYLVDLGGSVHRISAGTVRISGNVGVGNVLLDYTDVTPKQTASSPDGTYSIDVPYSWSGTVTPSLSCVSFAPPMRTYDAVAADENLQDYSYTIDASAACAHVDVKVAEIPKGSYGLSTGALVTAAYSALIGGPVNVLSTSGQPILASERNAYLSSSFYEIMGYPADQLTSEYWFPWYDHVYMRTWVLVGNPHPTETAYVDINIAGENQDHYQIPPGGRITPEYDSLIGGPVQVLSTPNNNAVTVDIFASERVTYQSSVGEVMGYPAEQFTTEYWFPWYDHVYMRTWVLVGNPHPTETAYVDINIAGENQDHYQIPPGGQITPEYDALIGGPVQVISTPNNNAVTVDVFTSERITYQNSVYEVMGFPANQFTTEYWYPYYDHVNMRTWVLVGNPHPTETAYVDINIAGVNKGHYQIPAGGQITPEYDALAAGPVQVLSTPNDNAVTVDIFTSQRYTYQGSVGEVMGYPADQLTDEYWFTWYDNYYIDASLVLGTP